MESLKTEVEQKDFELGMKDIEMDSQRKKIDWLLTKVSLLNQKLKSKQNPDHVKMELQQKTITEKNTVLKKQKIDISKLENDISILNTKLKDSEENSGQDQLKIELLQQKNIKEQNTELKKQKIEISKLENEITILNTKLKSSEDKSEQDQLKVELLQKTISNLKTELQKQAAQILQLRKPISHHNQKLDNIQPDQIVGHYFQQDLIQAEETKITKQLKVQLRDLMTVYPLRATQSLFKATSNTNLRSKQKENSR
jgi:uncharacterized coiled-coil protein SlyX